MPPGRTPADRGAAHAEVAGDAAALGRGQGRRSAIALNPDTPLTGPGPTRHASSSRSCRCSSPEASAHPRGARQDPALRRDTDVDGAETAPPGDAATSRWRAARRSAPDSAVLALRGTHGAVVPQEEVLAGSDQRNDGVRQELGADARRERERACRPPHEHRGARRSEMLLDPASPARPSARVRAHRSSQQGRLPRGLRALARTRAKRAERRPRMPKHRIAILDFSFSAARRASSRAQRARRTPPSRAHALPRRERARTHEGVTAKTPHARAPLPLPFVSRPTRRRRVRLRSPPRRRHGRRARRSSAPHSARGEHDPHGTLPDGFSAPSSPDRPHVDRRRDEQQCCSRSSRSGFETSAAGRHRRRPRRPRSRRRPRAGQGQGKGGCSRGGPALPDGRARVPRPPPSRRSRARARRPHPRRSPLATAPRSTRGRHADGADLVIFRARRRSLPADARAPPSHTRRRPPPATSSPPRARAPSPRRRLKVPGRRSPSARAPGLARRAHLVLATESDALALARPRGSRRLAPRAARRVAARGHRDGRGRVRRAPSMATHAAGRFRTARARGRRRDRRHGLRVRRDGGAGAPRGDGSRGRRGARGGRGVLIAGRGGRTGGHATSGAPPSAVAVSRPRHPAGPRERVEKCMCATGAAAGPASRPNAARRARRRRR